MELAEPLRAVLGILQMAYPDGLPRRDYLPLLVVLGDLMCDRSRAELGEDPARFGGRRCGRPVGPAVRQVRVTAEAGRRRMRAEASAG